MDRQISKCKQSELRDSLVNLDANTGSTKHRRSPAMVAVMRAREYRARLHGISVLVGSRRNAAHATLRLLSFGNGRSQNRLFLFRWGDQARWGTRRGSAVWSSNGDRDGLWGWETWYGGGWAPYLRGRRMDRRDLLAMSLVIRCRSIVRKRATAWETTDLRGASSPLHGENSA